MTDDPGAATVDTVVPPDLAGQRADRVVAVIARMSRAAARAAVEEGRVLVDGAPVDPALRLAGGARISIEVPAAPDGIQPLAAPLEVRYESPALLVVDKPPGLVVHPGAGHRDDTLASVLIHHYPELAELGVDHRWGLVHRLDRDTSGLLIVARSATAHEQLQARLRRRQIERVYLTLVEAVIDPATGTIEAPIGRDPEVPTRMALRQDGRFARTHYRRLAAWGDVSLLEVKLDTGRTHQIRLHLSSIGAPVVGDKTYGRRRGAGPGRVWLHAHRLTFPDPAADETSPVTVTSPLPADLAATLASRGEPRLGALP